MSTDGTDGEIKPAPLPPVAAAADGIPKPPPEFLRGSAIGGALIVSTAAFVTVLVLSILATLLLGLTALDHGLSNLTSQAGVPSSVVTDSGVSAQFLPIFLIIGSLALLGDVSAHLFGSGSAIYGAFAFTPLLLTAVIAFITAWTGYAIERRRPTTSRSGLLLLSLASALALSFVWTVLVVIAHPYASGRDIDVSLSSGDARTFFGALVLVFSATLLGRWVARRDPGASIARFPRELRARVAGAPRIVRDSTTAVFIGAVVFGALTLVGGLVAIGTQVGWGTAFGTLLLWWGPATLFGAVIGQFGAIWALASGGSGGVSVSSATFVSVLDNGWFWLLVLGAVVTATVAGLRISQRRGWSERRALASAWRLPVVAASAWLLLPWIIGLEFASGTGDLPTIGNGTASLIVAVAPWFFLIGGVWGIAVELFCRFVAPVLVTSYPLAARVAGGARGPALDSPAPLAARGRRRVTVGLIVGGAAVVVAAVLGGGISYLSSTVYGPSAVTSSYLNRIATGDLSAANATVPFGSHGGTALTSSKVLPVGDRITQPRVDKMAVSGDHATALVSYVLGGKRRTAELSLVSSGSQLVIFSKWRLTTPLAATISVVVDGAKKVSVNGATASISEGYGRIAVYPGRYVVTIPASKWLTATKKTVYATEGGLASAQLQVRPTPALKTEVDRQVKALIDGCAAQQIPAPANCPFQAYTFGTVSGFHWTVKSYPKATLSTDGTTFELDGGQVTADYTESDFGFTDAQSDDASVFGFGDVVISGDKVSLKFN